MDALPSQTSQSGKFLTTDGSDASWGAVASSGFVAVTFYTDTSGDTWSKSTNNPTKIIVEVISGAGGSGDGGQFSGRFNKTTRQMYFAQGDRSVAAYSQDAAIELTVDIIGYGE